MKNREPTLAERMAMAAKAKQAQLEKARAIAAANQEGQAERQAARQEAAKARDERQAERKLAKAKEAPGQTLACNESPFACIAIAIRIALKLVAISVSAPKRTAREERSAMTPTKATIPKINIGGDPMPPGLPIKTCHGWPTSLLIPLSISHLVGCMSALVDQGASAPTLVKINTPNF